MIYSKKLGLWLERLGPGETAPEGSREVEGSRGGRYYVVGKKKTGDQDRGESSAPEQEVPSYVRMINELPDNVPNGVVKALRWMAFGKDLDLSGEDLVINGLLKSFDRDSYDSVFSTLLEMYKNKVSSSSTRSLILKMAELVSPRLALEAVSIGIGVTPLSLSDEGLTEVLESKNGKYMTSKTSVRIHTDDQLKAFLEADLSDPSEEIISLMSNLTQSQLSTVEKFIQDKFKERLTSSRDRAMKILRDHIALKKKIYKNEGRLLAVVKDMGIEGFSENLMSDELKDSLKKVSNHGEKDPSEYSIQFAHELFNVLGLGDLHSVFRTYWEGSASSLPSIALRHQVGRMYDGGKEYSLGDYNQGVKDLDAFCNVLVDVTKERFGRNRFEEYTKTLKQLSRKMMDISFPDTDEIKIYRGSSVYETDREKLRGMGKKGKDIPVRSNPVSSWTLMRGVAYDFASDQGNNVGLIFETTVPKDEIFTYSAIYANMGNEREILLINKDDRKCDVEALMSK